ncbi:alpha/beta hydrolase [Phototrophicus methaneseepsis]|uniref:Alpha/beta hydrolase n=1 Tax=Phototrophicus methaneseepsis TaxID=2710758 RepID=A0A7S8E8Y5_9CHLR|nr:alpha/beta hydrolase [Phototrophicus methaneseepsis]QPC82578.1 alpha/beta hydrolase [Phototrophicus methaneseepsis]
MQIIDDLIYGKGGASDLHATFYRPAAEERPLPVILWVHGGAWMAGDRLDDDHYCRRIIRAGFACLSINYRLSDEAIFPAAIQDCKCAVRYLRAHTSELGIQPDKIGAWGPSAGGHLVTLLGTSAQVADFEGTGGWPEQDSSVQAVCDWFGPTNFTAMSDFPSDQDHRAPDAPESLFIGGPVHDYPDRVAKANPITYISATTPPIYIAHGTNDRIVPLNQSELLYDALKAQGCDVTFERIQGAGHGGPGFGADEPLFARCLAFFKAQLAVS